jgi:hypothetical protein
MFNVLRSLDEIHEMLYAAIRREWGGWSWPNFARYLCWKFESVEHWRYGPAPCWL